MCVFYIDKCIYTSFKNVCIVVIMVARGFECGLNPFKILGYVTFISYE